MRRSFLSDETGSAMVEMTLVFALMMALTFGIFEGGLLFWQWNSAEKATQIGARGAAVSTPVAVELATFDCGNGDSAIPGGTSCADVLNVFGKPKVFDKITCSTPSETDGPDITGTCSCTGTCGGRYTFSAANFRVVLNAMQRVFPRVQPRNVTVQYTDLGLGFVGRGSFVGSVTVRLTGMTFDFVAMGGLLDFLSAGAVRIDRITMPDFRATLGTEDLNSSGVS